MAVSDQLREAIEKSGETQYAVAKGAGISPIVVGRFVSGERPNIRADTIDRLAGYLGLELLRAKPQPSQAKKGKAPAAKQPAKKR